MSLLAKLTIALQENTTVQREATPLLNSLIEELARSNDLEERLIKILESVVGPDEEDKVVDIGVEVSAPKEN